jgi:hypothetical protein
MFFFFFFFFLGIGSHTLTLEIWYVYNFYITFLQLQQLQQLILKSTIGCVWPTCRKRDPMISLKKNKKLLELYKNYKRIIYLNIITLNVLQTHDHKYGTSSSSEKSKCTNTSLPNQCPKDKCCNFEDNPKESILIFFHPNTGGNLGSHVEFVSYRITFRFISLICETCDHLNDWEHQSHHFLFNYFCLFIYFYFFCITYILIQIHLLILLLFIFYFLFF